MSVHIEHPASVLNVRVPRLDGLMPAAFRMFVALVGLYTYRLELPKL